MVAVQGSVIARGECTAALVAAQAPDLAAPYVAASSVLSEFGVLAAAVTVCGGALASVAESAASVLESAIAVTLAAPSDAAMGA